MSQANSNWLGYEFRLIRRAKTIQLGPVGVAALGVQGRREWESINPPGANDTLSGMDAVERYDYGSYMIP